MEPWTQSGKADIFSENIYCLWVSYDTVLITQGMYTLPISWIKIKHV